ncbi:FCS-Like Zinc finger 6-like [Phragmites australis]|uniref:FCS-Like Zinc finger 6-like n=1 Tax=Phragmites australis TaxID=29695 RepID=UPI002D76D0BE|nr:FCS-Like Zinc finger 6-like [Phragmites australis]
MQDTTAAAKAAVPEMEEEEERYVKVASRFFRVKPRGGDAMAHLHYLKSCFLCKKNIACNCNIFMYKGDAAFCSEDCRGEQMDMDEALHAVARRHRLLRMPSSPAPRGEAATRPPMMRRRPTIANLAARNPPVTAS